MGMGITEAQTAIGDNLHLHLTTCHAHREIFHSGKRERACKGASEKAAIGPPFSSSLASLSALLLLENLKIPDAATEAHCGNLTHSSELFAGMELGMQGVGMATITATQIPPITMAMITAMSQLVTTMATTMAMGRDSRHHPLSTLAMATTMVRICPLLPHLWSLQDMPSL